MQIQIFISTCKFYNECFFLNIYAYCVQLYIFVHLNFL